MVAQRAPRAPRALASSEPPPFISLHVNGVPMRFRASGLRPALDAYLDRARDALSDPAMDAKTRAMTFALKQLVGAMLPIMRPLVNTLHDAPVTPPAVKRILRPMERPPKHADRVLFLLSYLCDAAHAALTENTWALDMANDPDSDDPDALRVVGFYPVEDDESAGPLALPDPNVPEGDEHE